VEGRRGVKSSSHSPVEVHVDPSGSREVSAAPNAANGGAKGQIQNARAICQKRKKSRKRIPQLEEVRSQRPGAQ